MRALSFEEPLSAQDLTLDKTIIPFKRGERASGMTPGGAEGWQQTNLRVAMAYDEAGRSETTPISLATPTRALITCRCDAHHVQPCSSDATLAAQLHPRVEQLFRYMPERTTYPTDSDTGSRVR